MPASRSAVGQDSRAPPKRWRNWRKWPWTKTRWYPHPAAWSWRPSTASLSRWSSKGDRHVQGRRGEQAMRAKLLAKRLPVIGIALLILLGVLVYFLYCAADPAAGRTLRIKALE